MEQELKLYHFADENLVALWKNCLRQTVGEVGEKAERLLGQIEREWKVRRASARTMQRRNADTFSDGPERGMLTTLGYHVGETNPTDSMLRRRILKRVVLGELPFVHSLEYTASWGRPCSLKRRAKLVRTLSSFIESSSVRRPKAVREWEADLAYVHSRFTDIQTVRYLTSFSAIEGALINA